MVNRGRSRGCVTCKQRRVKCDEAKPKCQTCQRLRLRCGGYKTKYANLKFRDQNHKFYTDLRAALPHQLAEPDTSVVFYLGHYAGIGRDIRSARGFYEVLIPVYCSQRPNSALSLAVTAVASKILSLWRHGGDGSFQSARETYAQAITHLRTAIQDRNERGKPATLLAVLMLQQYDNITAIYGLRSAARIHHNGAVSLLAYADSDYDVTTSAYIRRFILHSEISSAMRQKRPLQSIARSWIGSNYLTAAPENQSSALDAIGSSVVELQASYPKLMAAQEAQEETPLSQHDLREWVVAAKRIDEQLLTWARNVPDYWQPRKLISGQDIDSSIPTYQSVCEVYPSCQIAAVWNLWRVQRLLLVKIILGSLNTILLKNQLSAGSEDLVECKRTVLELVDSICHSVPFFLGNRAKVSSIADFTDPTILLPSCCHFGDKRRQYNADEHRRSIIAQGPWHIMSPLSRLLTLFLEDFGQLMATFLRPGQHKWIQKQFLRVTMLLRIPPAKSGDSAEGSHLLNSSAQGLVHIGVENIAKRVRNGAMFMSGP